MTQQPPDGIKTEVSKIIDQMIEDGVITVMREGVITAGERHAAVRWEDPISIGNPVFKAKGGREV